MRKEVNSTRFVNLVFSSLFSSSSYLQSLLVVPTGRYVCCCCMCQIFYVSNSIRLSVCHYDTTTTSCDCEKLPTQQYNHSHLYQRVKPYPSSYAEPNLAIFVLQQRDDPSHQRNRRVVLECHASPSLNLEEETKLVARKDG